MGGSQGARVFSDVIPTAIARLPRSLARRLEITQQCRPEDLDRVAAAYEPLGVQTKLQAFFDNVPELLMDTHLLIARSGASTVAEVSVAGRPSVLVPYPFAADDHQTANAKALSQAGGAWLMDQSTFTPENLAARLTQFLVEPQMLADAADAAAAFSIPDAAGRLAEVIGSLIRDENGGRHGAPTSSATSPPPVTPGAV
jgi:UDP-N-acetylglucosamine--N-acetylmuramyl-(pentapeptide) pyrophosphoryl-undecaprenol N-acetylglucosamine transferase